MISLYVNHYAAGDQKRQAEIDQCLRNNFENPLIDRIIILAQSAPELRKDLQHPQAVWRDIDCRNKLEQRPAFGDFFACINELTTAPDEIHIVAHSDVYFDESLGSVRDLNLELVCLALTRWEINKKREFHPHLWDTSQDAWIFQGHIRPVGDVDIPIGAPGAEGRLTWRLRQGDYKVVNPSLDLKSIHLHASGVHTTAAQIGPPREDVWRGSLAATKIPTGRQFKTGLISMSLFGKKAKYLAGAVENARLVRHIYPGWTLRFYVDSSVPATVIVQLKQLKAEVFIMPDGAGMYGLFWRFLAADDPGFARWMVRDADSRLNYRERRAVDEWIESGLPFHTMRDHPAHLRPIMGCAFGGVRGALPNMQQTIAAWPTKGKYADDESMLAEVIYPLVKDSMLVHDSFAQEYSDKVRPFPMERENFRFVGERFDENQEHNNNDRNALIAQLAARKFEIATLGEKPKIGTSRAEALTKTESNSKIQQQFKQALQLQNGGRYSESEKIYRQILSVGPKHSKSIHQLGLLAVQTGRIKDALGLFQQAIAIDPQVALYHSNLGNVLATLKRHEEAIASYRQAIKLKPDYAMAHNNLGSLLETQGYMDEAVESLKTAIKLKPDYADAHANLGNAFQRQGHTSAAIKEYRAALTISPQFAAAHSNLIYAMHYEPDYDPKTVELERQCWDQQHAQPLKKFIQSYANDRNPNRRLKIGYLSPDFHEHSVSYFIENILAAHDRNAVEVYCYADVANPDQATKRMESYIDADHWRNILALSNQKVAQMIHQDNIDILVDLAGHTANNRLTLFALKPSPIQVSYLGYECLYFQL
ncbi:MAG TPA: tetratricopeptide repeat protein [Phycisphaerae bacterium]|nr:tetratricopeptide repeat protein [Phycisphaerae bacterium]